MLGDVVQTELSSRPEETRFVLRGLTVAEEAAAIDLGFARMDGELVRRFPSHLPGIERTFHRFEQCAARMLAQTARLEPVPWDRALATFVERAEGVATTWWVTGSAALAARGIEVGARDIDIVVEDGAAAQALGELFDAELVEPVTPSVGWVADWFGRAFVHARVEWVGSVRPEVDEPVASDFGPAAARALEEIEWRGHTLRVPPLSLQRDVARRRGLAERTAAIEAALARA
jgi:hypothetical protein